MRRTTGRRGTHVEDRRGIRISRGIAGGGIGTILLVIVTLCLGLEPGTILNQAGGGTAVRQRAEERPEDGHRLGLESGELARCDTFSSPEL